MSKTNLNVHVFEQTKPDPVEPEEGSKEWCQDHIEDPRCEQYRPIDPVDPVDPTPIGPTEPVNPIPVEPADPTPADPVSPSAPETSETTGDFGVNTVFRESGYNHSTTSTLEIATIGLILFFCLIAASFVLTKILNKHHEKNIFYNFSKKTAKLRCLLLVVTFIASISCTFATIRANTTAVTGEIELSVVSADEVGIEVEKKADTSSLVYQHDTISLPSSATGYTLYLSADSNQLTGKENPETFIPSVSSEGKLDNDMFGISLDAPTLDTDFIQLPSNEMIEIYSVSNAVEAQALDIYYAVNIKDLPAGNYAVNLTFTLKTHPAMQDMTAEICSSLEEEETYIFKDIRDGKEYSIERLKDGNCWMTTNLALELRGPENPTILTPENSDVTEDWIPNHDTEIYDLSDYEEYEEEPLVPAMLTPSSTKHNNSQNSSFARSDIIPESQGEDEQELPEENNIENRMWYCFLPEDTEWEEYDFDRCVLENSIGSIRYDDGEAEESYYFYDWSTATAQTGNYGSPTNTEASSSICPKGWKLPSKNNYSALRESQALEELSVRFNDKMSMGIFSKEINDGMAYHFNLYWNETSAFYWTRNKSMDNDSAYSLYADSINQYYSDSSTSYIGDANPVRCVYDVTYGSASIVFDKNTDSEVSVPEDIIFSNQSFYFDTMVEIPVEIPTLDGHRFLGWSKNPEAKTAEYIAGSTYEINIKKDEKLRLYAVWAPETITFRFNTNNGTDQQNTVEVSPQTGRITKTTSSINDAGEKKTSIDDASVYPLNQDYYEDITIPGANELELTIYYSVDEVDYHWICIFDGTDYEPTPKDNCWESISGQMGDGLSETQYSYVKNFHVNSDTVRIYFHTDDCGQYYGYWAEISGIVNTNEILSGEYQKPARDGYEFLGWSEDQDATYATYKDFESIPAYKQDAAFYAVWQELPSRARAILTDNGNLDFVYDKKEYNIGDTYTYYIDDITSFSHEIIEIFDIDEYNESDHWFERDDISSVNFENSFYDFKPVILSEWFAGDYNIQSFNNVSNLNTSEATDIVAMFAGVGSNADDFVLDLSSWDVSKVTNMEGAFNEVGYEANTLYLNLSSWNTGNVENMAYMFADAGNESLSVTIDFSQWDTSKVANMEGMFLYAGYNADETHLSLSALDTENVTNMSSMLVGVPFDTKDSSFDISAWNTSKVENMGYMFYDTYSIADNYVLDLSSWDTSSVVDMTSMFRNSGVETIIVGDLWTTSNVENGANMFQGTSNLIGGANTIWKSTNANDESYAHIDGGSTNPGYLTYNGYSIIFEPTDGELPQNTNQFSPRDGSEVHDFELTSIIPSGEGLEFLGWSEEQGATTPMYAYNDGIFAPKTIISNIAQTKILYAVWQYPTITFNYNDGTESQNEVTYKPHNEFQTLTTSSKSSNGGRKTSKQDTTRYANNLNYYDDIKIPGAKSIKVKIYYSTESTSYDWVCVFQGTAYTPGSSDSCTKSITGKMGGGKSSSYSYYREITIDGNTARIYFHSNSSSIYYGYWAEVSGEADYNEIVSGEYLIPTREEYNLLGWSEDKDATEATYGTDFSTFPTFSENKTLYAVWQERPLVSKAIFTEDGNLNFVYDRKVYEAGNNYSYSIDGTTTLTSTINAVYAVPDSSSESNKPAWTGNYPSYRTDITSANFDSSFKNFSPISTSYWFYCDNYLSTITNTQNLNVSNVVDMSYMFAYNTRLTSVNLSSWDTSNAKNMSCMFLNTSNLPLTDIGILNWNTSKVEDMSGMFFNSTAKTTEFYFDLSNWDTGNVIDMSSMFWNMCSNSSSTDNVLFHLDLSGWDTGSVMDMSKMFGSDSVIGEKIKESSSWIIDGLQDWNTSNVKDMHSMFSSAGKYYQLWSVNLSGWDTGNVQDMSSMFYYAGYSATSWSVGDISKWKPKNATSAHSMFYNAGYNAETFSLDLSSWDVSSLTSTEYMFSHAGGNASTFALDLSNWNTASIENMRYMFFEAGKNSTSWEIEGLSSWKTASVVNMDSMFESAGFATTTFYLNLSGWNTGKVTSMSGMFSAAGYRSKSWKIDGLSEWNTGNVKDMSGMFDRVGSLNSANIILDLSGWDTSKVTTMTYMFYGARNIVTIYVGDKWNTENVVNSTTMFGRYTKDFRITGGAGTKWSSSNPTDKTYARIDRPDLDQPGYFTDIADKPAEEKSEPLGVEKSTKSSNLDPAVIAVVIASVILVSVGIFIIIILEKHRKEDKEE